MFVSHQDKQIRIRRKKNKTTTIDLPANFKTGTTLTVRDGWAFIMSVSS